MSVFPTHAVWHINLSVNAKMRYVLAAKPTLPYLTRSYNDLKRFLPANLQSEGQTPITEAT